MTTFRGWPPEIAAMVTSDALDGLTASEIMRKLEAALLHGEIDVEKLPDVRTIQRRVKALRPVDRSGRWRLSPTHEEVAGFVLAVRAELMTETDGRVSEISKETASWLLTVHAVAPDLELISAHRVARIYQVRAEKGQDTGDLDAWLGFAPWRNAIALARYEGAVAGGWIKPPPTLTLNMLARLAKTASPGP